MTPMLQAVHAAERFIGAGIEPRFAVYSAAHLHVVDAQEVALLLLAKLIGVQRARAAVQAMQEADDQ